MAPALPPLEEVESASRSRELGVFWQDEIRFGDAFAVIPGVRWERYRLDAEADAMFREDYPEEIHPVEREDGESLASYGDSFSAFTDDHYESFCEFAP